MNTDQKSLNGILIAMSEYHTGSQKDAIAAISAIYDGGMMIVDQQPHAAKVSWAIEILRSHNQWRRGSDTVEMANPTDLGNAIEIAIGVMDRANREILKEGDILSPPLAAPVVPDGWCYDMAKAPKDQGRFLALHEDGHVSFARWDGYREFVVVNNGDYGDGGYGRDYQVKPNYANSDYEPIIGWQPLPAAADKREGEK